MIWDLAVHQWRNDTIHAISDLMQDTESETITPIYQNNFLGLFDVACFDQIKVHAGSH